MFPSIKAKNLRGEQVDFPSCRGDSIKLVGFSFKQFGFEMVPSWINPFKARFERNSAITTMQLCFIELSMLRYLHTLIEASVRSQVPQADHGDTLVRYGDVEVTAFIRLCGCVAFDHVLTIGLRGCKTGVCAAAEDSQPGNGVRVSVGQAQQSALDRYGQGDRGGARVSVFVHGAAVAAGARTERQFRRLQRIQATIVYFFFAVNTLSPFGNAKLRNTFTENACELYGSSSPPLGGSDRVSKCVELLAWKRRRAIRSRVVACCVGLHIP